MTPTNANLREAASQAMQVRADLVEHDLELAGVHLAEAFASLQRATAAGEDHEQCANLREELGDFAFRDWLPFATEYANTLDDTGRAVFFAVIVDVIRAGSPWLAPPVAAALLEGFGANAPSLRA